jgi:hypothetical protein
MNVERDHLLPLVREGFQLAGVHFARVDTKGTVKVLTNFYSVPLAVGVEVQAKVYPAHVEVWRQGGCVARHERSFGRYQPVLDLEHYLEVLLKKPGAMAGSTALEQWRAQGRWPGSYDRFREALRDRQGKQEGTRAMVEVLLLGREHGWGELEGAVNQALKLGCFDVGAVRLLVRSTTGSGPAKASELVEIGVLSRYDRPQPRMKDYDQLLHEWSGTEVVQ